MKTTIGGDRLGSGSKSEVSAKNYSRSTHDLSYKWRSSMSSGTLVPFMSELALPGDTWDIDLNCDVKTLPTIGPLFGSYKVQLDIFECPIRLYQGKLHMNMINIGMDMGAIKLPQFTMVGTFDPDKIDTEGDNMQVNPSSIYAYLNVRGLGRTNSGNEGDVRRSFNAVPLLAYWEIYKNYYANLQEERNGKAQGKVIHQSLLDNHYTAFLGTSLGNLQNMYMNGVAQGNPYDGTISLAGVTTNDGIGFNAVYYWPHQGAPEGNVNINTIKLEVNGVLTNLIDLFQNVQFNGVEGTFYNQVSASQWIGPLGNITITGVGQEDVLNVISVGDGAPRLQGFDLENIDEMREKILSAVGNSAAVEVDYNTFAPYGLGLDTTAGVGSGDWSKPYCTSNQEGLAIKTYQSDLFNNWISTRWIDGPNGVGEVSAVVVQTNQAGTDEVVYMDSLNLQQKVYNMLNRIAVSGGTYDDWLDAVYTHERAKSIESPVYHGSLIKSLAFEEVISQADTSVDGNTQPLGTLAGRGRLTNKHKGGRVKIKVSEPSYIMGIISITPGASGLDYSQGNKWDMNLKSMDDFYKPELGQIGYEQLITGAMHWAGDTTDVNGNVKHSSAGKQPAWINYMTNVNRTRGNFAIGSATDGPVGEMFMTLNRRYEFDKFGITDVTTYIDPSKFNNIFALTDTSAQNFWVQVGNKITCRRKMSAKTIPNL